MPTLAVADDELFLLHEGPPGHVECPERLLAARRGLARSAWQTDAARRWQLAPRDASEVELLRVHEVGYLKALRAIAGKLGHLDADTYFSQDSYDATLRAAGASLALTDAVLGGQAEYGFGLLRPPGHHACPDRAMGFCLLNNAALAARHAQAAGARRVLVFDWDVHHGNGTQDIFWADPSVLYVSLHQSPQYPGTGGNEESGAGDGLGFSVNVPLSRGAGDGVYLAALRRIVLPIVAAFRPDLTVVSAGYDAHRRDPLGGMALTDTGYGVLTRELVGALGNPAAVVFLLEGGYDFVALEGSVAATCDALLEPPAQCDESVSARHERELARALDVQRRFWPV